MARVRWNLLIPRLNVSAPSVMVKGTLIEALVQLEYKSPTKKPKICLLHYDVIMKEMDDEAAAKRLTSLSLCYQSHSVLNNC